MEETSPELKKEIEQLSSNIEYTSVTDSDNILHTSRFALMYKNANLKIDHNDTSEFHNHNDTTTLSVVPPDAN